MYTYVGGNPISNTDPSGEFGLVGALIGAAFEIGKETLYDGKSLGCVNLGAVAVSAAAGAFGPGFFALGKSALGLSAGVLAEFTTSELAAWQGLVVFPKTIFIKGTQNKRWTASSNCSGSNTESTSGSGSGGGGNGATGSTNH
ncbi:hypothetical protein AAKU58_004404 [Oxalobacteraceae bacterium GrIS 1.18]